jgi:hypothetical protein
MAAKRKMTAKELDALHDSGADMSGHLDTRASRRPGLEIHRVNVDFPIWMIESLDQEAGRLGVPRQSVIKFWISECLAGKSGKRASQSRDPASAPGTSSARREPRHR